MVTVMTRVFFILLTIKHNSYGSPQLYAAKTSTQATIQEVNSSRNQVNQFPEITALTKQITKTNKQTSVKQGFRYYINSLGVIISVLIFLYLWNQEKHVEKGNLDLKEDNNDIRIFFHQANSFYKWFWILEAVICFIFLFIRFNNIIATVLLFVFSLAICVAVILFTTTIPANKRIYTYFFDTVKHKTDDFIILNELKYQIPYYFILILIHHCILLVPIFLSRNHKTNKKHIKEMKQIEKKLSTIPQSEINSYYML